MGSSKITLSVSTLAIFIFTGCATLLGLPDEQNEGHYTQISKISSEQVQAKIKSVGEAKAASPKEGSPKKIIVLPIVYRYTTYNTLKKGEEAYYTSRFTNGSWIRPFTLIAQESIDKMLTERGYDYTLLSNNLLQKMGAKDIQSMISPNERRRQDPVRAVALNAENEDTNLAIIEQSAFSKYVSDEEQAVMYVEFDVDWEPNTANTLNKDIVLNTSLSIGYKMVFCGATGCSTSEIPFRTPLVASLFMPNKNTINKDGAQRNYELIKQLHAQQLDQLLKESFIYLDKTGAFLK